MKTLALLFVQFLWLFTILGCLLGALIGITGILAAKGAPQEASAAAIAVACAVIPYCLARAVSEIFFERGN